MSTFLPQHPENQPGAEPSPARGAPTSSDPAPAEGDGHPAAEPHRGLQGPRTGWTRRRLFGFALVALLLLFGGRAFLGQPQSVEVLYRFDAVSSQIREARLTYRAPNDDAPLRTVTWSFGAGGAPREKVHPLRLPAGLHRVQVEVLHADGQWHRGEAQVDVPLFSQARMVVEVPETLRLPLLP